jgi:hypothetical protein
MIVVLTITVSFVFPSVNNYVWDVNTYHSVMLICITLRLKSNYQKKVEIVAQQRRKRLSPTAGMEVESPLTVHIYSGVLGPVEAL